MTASLEGGYSPLATAMPLKIASRSAISPFIVMEVMNAAAARAASGGDVLHLEVGQPSTPAPRKVLEAAHRALDSDVLGYTGALGLPALRQAISRHYRDTSGAEAPSERIAISAGASGAFVLAFLAAFDAGDRVAMASPGYPAYRNILQALSVEVVSLPMGTESNFQPTVAALQSAGRLDGLIIASPANPTGALIPEAQLRELVDYCRADGIRLVSDEIYHGITYGQPATSVACLWEEAIVVNSFSKYFSMTGWRLGWLLLPEDLVRPVERLAQNLFISPPTLSQLAAIAAFESHDELQGNVRRYADNRELLLQRLPEAGFDRLTEPGGAFYIYADVSAMTDDSVVFCQAILRETGVAVTPGVDFDPERGKRYLRFSFAGATADMAAAARRLREWRAGDR